MRVTHFPWLVLSLLLATVGVPKLTNASSCPTHADCVLRVSHQDKPTDLNAGNGVGSWSMNLIINVFEGLFTMDQNSQAIPGQVSHWERSEDGLVYTFHLREDAHWSDGAPVSADDFVIPWRSHFLEDTNGTTTYLLKGLENAQEVIDGSLPVDELGLRALDARTIEIRLSHPQSYLLSILANPILVPAPLHVIGEYSPTERWADGDTLVYNGAFVMTGTVSDDVIRLRKNTKYYDADHVYFDRIEISTGNQLNGEAVSRFLEGELDLARASDQVEFSDEARVFLQTDPAASGTYLLIKMDHPVLKTPSVRKALAMTSWPDDILPVAGSVTALYSLLPPSVNGYPDDAPRPTWADRPLEARILEARRMMESAGYNAQNPLKLSLKMLDYATERSVGRSLTNIWRQIHVVVDPTFNGIGAHYSQEHIMGRHFDLGELTWFADFNDAHNFLTMLRTGEYPNFGHWQNSRYDALIERYERSADKSERDEFVREMLTILMDNNALIPMYQRRKDSLVQRGIRGFEPNALAFHPYRFVSRAEPEE